MKIKKISFLFNDERVFLESNIFGKFLVPVTKTKRGRKKTVEKPFTAKQVINHPVVKSADPFLTTHEEEKIRVFQGGDPAYMLTYSASIIDLHDAECRKLHPSSDFSDWYDEDFSPF